MNEAKKAELQDMFATLDTKVIIQSDGQGNISTVVENDGHDTDALAEGVDIALAALSQFAATQSLGTPEITMQMCEQGIVFCKPQSNGGAIALISKTSSNVGLILNVLRRMSSEVSA